MRIRLHKVVIGIFCMSTMFATGLSLKAQTHYQSNVSIGLKGGAEMSRVFFNPGVHQGLPFGTIAGVQFRYIEENHFGLIAELNYAQRGWSENFEDAPYNYRRTLNYLQLPILAHIYFGRRGKFFINAGPEFGVLLRETTNSNFDAQNIAALPDFPIGNRMNTQLTMPVENKFDYGISAGVGGEFSINRNNSVCIEARFYYGLGNIFKSKRTDPFSASNSMSVMFTAGYWLRIK